MMTLIIEEVNEYEMSAFYDTWRRIFNGLIVCLFRRGTSLFDIL